MRRATDLGIVERVTWSARSAATVGGSHARRSGFRLAVAGEPFGIALLEAMAAGVPTVAAAAGGVPEMARDGENALVVPSEDSEALSSALARLVTDVSYVPASAKAVA